MTTAIAARWGEMSAKEKQDAIRPYADAGKSSGEIAAILGISRNTVVGVAHRSKGSVRLTGGRPRSEEKKKPRRKDPEQQRRALGRRGAVVARKRNHRNWFPARPPQFATVGVPKAKVWEPLPGTTPVSLMDRTGCAFPVTVEGRTLFCNCPRELGGSYCPTHAAVVWRRET